LPRAVVSRSVDELTINPGLRCGVDISVNLDELIESVYVAPKAQPFFAALVEAIMRRYGLPKSVIPSDVLREPASLLAEIE
jgi:hypothetical protein